MPENCIYIARSSAIAARALAGEMMVMNSADSTFFTLNEVATTIFQAADGHTPLREIVRDRICEQFDVDPEQAQADAERFVTELSGHGQGVTRPTSGPSALGHEADELRAGCFGGGAHAASGQLNGEVFVDTSRGAGRRARSRRLDQPRGRVRTGAQRTHDQEISAAHLR